MPAGPDKDKDALDIAGAGPAGLAAAITLARAGRRVVLHEAHGEVGHRFQGDLQGLEVGYHFDTAMEDGFWVICDDALAPKGYAYLLVMHGKGTVKSCMFTGFKEESLYVQRTVEAFERLAGLKMDNPCAHGGVGNFRIPSSAYSGLHPTVGEQAGFQDTLWGFGMRYAIASGVLAARSLLDGSDYDAMWRREFGPMLRAGVVNRALYGAFGERSHTWLLRHQERSIDARRFLFRLYRPMWAKWLLLPWARSRYRSRRRDISCDHVDCTCFWCRCGGEYA